MSRIQEYNDIKQKINMINLTDIFDSKWEVYIKYIHPFSDNENPYFKVEFKNNEKNILKLLAMPPNYHWHDSVLELLKEYIITKLESGLKDMNLLKIDVLNYYKNKLEKLKPVIKDEAEKLIKELDSNNINK